MSAPAEAWYYSTSSDVTSGPVSNARLQELFDAGSLSWHHSVRHRTWDRWYTVREAAGSLGFTSATLNQPILDPTAALPLPMLPSEQQVPVAGDSSPAPPTTVPAPFSSDIGKVPSQTTTNVSPAPAGIVVPPLPTVAPPPLPTVTSLSSTGHPVVTNVAGPARVSAASHRQSIAADAVTPTQRVVSWAIDIAAFVVVMLILEAVLPTDFAMLFTFAVYVLYLVVLPVQGYDTIGHLVVGLRVARRVDDGVSPWMVYGTRAAVVLLLGAPFMLGLIASACSMFGHPNALAWQDVASGTTVVKVKAFEFGKKAALVTVSATPSDLAP